MNMHKIIDRQERFDPRTSETRAQLLSLADVSDFLISPDSKLPIQFDGHSLKNASESFGMERACPVLMPHRCMRYIQDNRLIVPLDYTLDAFDQYLLISSIKQNQVDINLEVDDEWYQKHSFNAQKILSEFKGTVLDVGCGSPQVSRGLFTPDVKYFGIDPTFSALDEFHLIAMAEFLPIKDASLDGIVFSTSLDHVFDYHRALDEAYRVLKPGGRLFVASLVWTESAELYNDSVHFHHFREDELMLALKRFSIGEVARYNWKNNKHRYGVYISGEK
jgi:SAM-dependent methyltransferase